jgi:urea transport system permease protein
VDWWTVLLGLSFVAVTLFAPKGIGGLVDLIAIAGPRTGTAPTSAPTKARCAKRRRRE